MVVAGGSQESENSRYLMCPPAEPGYFFIFAVQIYKKNPTLSRLYLFHFREILIFLLSLLAQALLSLLYKAY